MGIRIDRIVSASHQRWQILGTGSTVDGSCGEHTFDRLRHIEVVGQRAIDQCVELWIVEGMPPTLQIAGFGWISRHRMLPLGGQRCCHLGYRRGAAEQPTEQTAARKIAQGSTIQHAERHDAFCLVAVARRWCMEVSGVVIAAIVAAASAYCDGKAACAIPEWAGRTGRMQPPLWG